MPPYRSEGKSHAPFSRSPAPPPVSRRAERRRPWFVSRACDSLLALHLSQRRWKAPAPPFLECRHQEHHEHLVPPSSRRIAGARSQDPAPFLLQLCALPPARIRSQPISRRTLTSRRSATACWSRSPRSAAIWPPARALRFACCHGPGKSRAQASCITSHLTRFRLCDRHRKPRLCADRRRRLRADQRRLLPGEIPAASKGTQFESSEDEELQEQELKALSSYYLDLRQVYSLIIFLS
ncbi:uncharacterized protein LOC120639925 [Panicum virgatum]|uniref:uncharacterized protein LOC120639925 n=1 Tax=Panicum virgatum TaxID=38727 RepID=UPI0019D69064|nr:uncharacterized protein LOC120639925 [Panicum virgatum]